MAGDSVGGREKGFGFVVPTEIVSRPSTPAGVEQRRVPSRDTGMLGLVDMRKWFGTVEALDGCSFSVAFMATASSTAALGSAAAQPGDSPASAEATCRCSETHYEQRPRDGGRCSA